MTDKIDVIMFSMSHFTDWQKGRVNRNYHILREMEKDERIRKIVTVDFLPFGWKKAAKIYLEDIIFGLKNYELVYGDLTSACHQINNKVFVYSSIDSIFSSGIVNHEIERISRVLNLQNVVIWSYDPMFIKNLEIIAQRVKYKLFVFDAVDDWRPHSAFKRFRNKLERNYSIIRNDADLIFTVSKNLKDELFSARNHDIYWVPNGVEVDRFTAALKYPPARMQDIPHPIIGYQGIIQDRFDIDLVKYVAEKNPDKSIVLVGGRNESRFSFGHGWKSFNKFLELQLGGYKNIYLLPFVPYEQLPQYINQFDIGIVPHKLNLLTRSMNPLKIYEYLACGKPVVATDNKDMEQFGDLIYVGRTQEEFNQQIQLAFKEDNEMLRKARVDSLTDDTWTARERVMMDYVISKL